MKYKTLLIPLMLFPLLSGCNKEEEHIEIDKFLEVKNDEGAGYFTVNDITTFDYDSVVQNIFKKHVTGLVKEDNFSIPEDSYSWVTFEIAGEYNNYSYFVIDVFSNGQINTICTGGNKEQDTTYMAGIELTTAIINEVTERYIEIGRIVEEYKANAIEEHNIDKFFEAAEALENKSFTYNDILYDETRSVVASTPHHINDEDGSLTNELKEVGYRYMPKHQNKRKDFHIEYKINDGWYFRLFASYYYVATITYKYSNPFYDTEVEMSYDINDRTKVDSFIEKLQNL